MAKSGSGCCSPLKPLLYFDTVKFVTVHSVKLGLFHRAIQIIVVLYIALFLIYYAKGYQGQSSVDGVIFSKLKGMGVVGDIFYDSIDLVIPPLEPDAFFVMSLFSRTIQHRGTCVSNVPTDVCKSNSDCIPQGTPSGFIQPICNTTQGYCLIRGWCPLETNISSEITGLDNMTVFVRSSVKYQTFGVYASDPETPVLEGPGKNLFNLSDMLDGFTVHNCSQIGCIVNVRIDWSCDLDLSSGCHPKFSFQRATGGFNYRDLEYLEEDQNSRILRKLYGIRFLMKITGVGKKFDFFTMAVTIGSGLAFLGIATVVTDFVLMCLFTTRENFQKRKWKQFSPDDENPLIT